MVFSQKNAARKKKCMHTAETKETNDFISFKIGENKIARCPVAHNENMQTITKPAL
jgi:hypothetical protein